MFCPYCGQQHPSGARFCPTTGKSLPVVQVEQNPYKRFYLGLAIFSTFLIMTSSYMLFVPKGPIPTLTPTIGVSLSPIVTREIIAVATPVVPATLTPMPVVKPIDLRVNSKDGAEIVLIPEGEFTMGSNPKDDPYFWGAEAPAHTVHLDSFWIYRTEVTQGMYQKCVDQKACPFPDRIDDPVAKQYGNPRFSDYPVVMVTWEAASSYCQWAGARLPTEAEWEKAARGTDGRLFPWGNDPNPDGHAIFSATSTSPVGSLPYGASPYSAFDMAGNVLEWVNDYFDSSYYQYSPLVNPHGPSSGSRRVIRGGAFTQEELAGLRTVARASLRPRDSKISVGFRCAVDEP
jgi:formylglycine-generating enzyme required for sulfatase activity